MLQKPRLQFLIIRVEIKLTDSITGQTIKNNELKAGQIINGSVEYVADNGFKVPAKDIQLKLSGNGQSTITTTSPSEFILMIGNDTSGAVNLNVSDNISGHFYNKIFSIVKQTPSDDNKPSEPGKLPSEPTDEPNDNPNNPQEQHFTISFDAKGHGINPDTLYVEEGSSILLPDLDEQDGFVFLGWSDGRNFYEPRATVPVNDNMHFVAQWRDTTVPSVPSNIQMIINSTQMIIDNKLTTMDTASYIRNDRTYVPIRALSEGFGANVIWNPDDRSVTVFLSDRTVVMNVGQPYYWINDEVYTMDVVPEIQEQTGRTFVPIRFVAEALGFIADPVYGFNGATTESVLFHRV